MKIKIGIVVLVVVSVGLFVALLATKKQSADQHVKDAASILGLSNQLETVNLNLTDVRQVNLVLTNDVVATHQALEAASNSLAATINTLAETKAALESSETQVTNLTFRVGDLEAQNRVLDERALTLSNTIAKLDAQIADTQQKLATSETNNVFLTSELQRQMSEKAELQRKFNDIDAVRAQVKKLRDELFVARRLQWINDGTSPGTQPKGAQLLMQHSATPAKPAASRSPQYDLNVEVGSDGSVHVIPASPSPQDTAVQSAARAALLKEMGGTNAAH